MAKVVVPCNNKQEAIAARRANLLWIDMFEDGRYELCDKNLLGMVIYD